MGLKRRKLMGRTGIVEAYKIGPELEKMKRKNGKVCRPLKFVINMLKVGEESVVTFYIPCEKQSLKGKVVRFAEILFIFFFHILGLDWVYTFKLCLALQYRNHLF